MLAASIIRAMSPRARLTHRPYDGNIKNPVDRHLHNHRRENLKSHLVGTFVTTIIRAVEDAVHISQEPKKMLYIYLKSQRRYCTYILRAKEIGRAHV
jgi:hypothetical protein